MLILFPSSTWDSWFVGFGFWLPDWVFFSNEHYLTDSIALVHLSLGLRSRQAVYYLSVYLCLEHGHEHFLFVTISFTFLFVAS